MKKIGIFTGYYLPHLGGVERYVDKLSGALMRLGYRVVIVTSNHGGQAGVEIDEKRTIYRIPIMSVAKERYPLPKVNAEYRRLIRQIKNEKIDYYLLNTRFHLTSLIGAKMGKEAGRPVLLIEHGTGHFTVNNRWLDYVGKLYEHVLTSILKKYVDQFYGVSKNCNVWLRHFSITAKGVFYNAIDTADEKDVENYYQDRYKDSEIIITYAGRLIKEKGILNLAQAFMKIKENNPKFQIKLVVAGDGDLYEFIKRSYTDPSIDILGRLDFVHVMALYKRTDIFVYPSLYPEGLPTSILEAGLMECAVIATPRGGTEEVIIDNQHGIITDGSVEDLRRALERLIANSSKRKELAHTLKHRIERVFNWNVVAKEVDKEVSKFDG